MASNTPKRDVPAPEWKADVPAWERLVSLVTTPGTGQVRLCYLLRSHYGPLIGSLPRRAGAPRPQAGRAAQLERPAAVDPCGFCAWHPRRGDPRRAAAGAGRNTERRALALAALPLELRATRAAGAG
ncbi:hypothetical protein EMIHUDRAFT_432990 [Emiliania huxleyi CCMP1516]|uniref:Uncharacterized protein n=2 Tax=Emiliania huxleyi TaxID=2903 RepID=A0A0D3I774_EMIH1|nr:hypothetical protein EMIHUDRAFT_432990 [Emiliania huxleyi CCMP1516]EOD07109.1 hypothetical protein EMIHUDRAFT_432990 [Emiliania huxleyi CCMP1516]|eukprot:XP_005759538.1 hypothetical protein EMIHUDRAFT_432990 [Emiliania huxleyi CCMP1516]